MKRLAVRRPLRAAAALVLLAAASAAVAHEDSVIDLEPVEQIVDARVGTATGKDRTTYKRLQKALRPASKEKLARDMAKLKALVLALGKLKTPDPELAGLLPAAIDAVDAALAAYPERVEVQIDRIARSKDRTKVETAALGAYDRHLDARELRRSDVAGSVAVFAKSVAAYEKALSTAAQTIRRQRGGLPQFKAPQPGRVYTVIGTGAGGFNGDDRASRRSALYFVDEVKFGPDGLLYVLDWNNHMVRRVRADGSLERICGSGVPGDSEGDPMETALNHPSSLAFAPDGKVFIAAWHNHKVKVFDPNVAGGPRVYTIAGTVQGKDTTDPALATQAKYNLLPGIVRLDNGDLLTCDAANQVIRRVRLSQPQEGTNVAGVTVTTGAIDKFAGTLGVEGYAGDGGQCSDAVLAFSKAQNAEPDGRMEVDGDGNVYVVCGKAHVIRKIEASGRITTFAGTGVGGYSGDDGLATAAQLNSPSDVAIAEDGTVYISDSGNNVIRRVGTDGKIVTYAGGTAGGFAGDGDVAANALFSRPGGIELDADGNLYVCDRQNSRVRVIAAEVDPGALQIPIDPYHLPLPSHGTPPTTGDSGTIDTIAGTPGVFGFNGNGLPSLDTLLYWPQDVTFDVQHGLVWFLDWNNHRVRRVEADGTITTVIGSGQLGDTVGSAPTVRLNHPTDLTFHPLTGELWVAGWHTDKILRLKSDDNTIVYMAGKGRAFTGDNGAPNLAEMNIPSSVKFDSAGNWYISDEGNRRIRFVDAGLDRITTICGNGTTAPLGDDGPAAAATLNFPVGQSAQPGGRVCLSPDDRYLYVADTNNHRVRRIDLEDPAQTITTIAGDGTAGYSGDGLAATAARLRYPTDVDCDAQGNVYICDSENHAIRKVAGGTITTVAGTGEYGYAGEGVPATEAKFFSPSGIHVVRSTGRIYVADTYNGVIRVIWE